MMCALLASLGRALSALMGSCPVCVEVIMSALGILTLTPILAGWMFCEMSECLPKWPVAPLSKTKGAGGEDEDSM